MIGIMKFCMTIPAFFPKMAFYLPEVQAALRGFYMPRSNIFPKTIVI